MQTAMTAVEWFIEQIGIIDIKDPYYADIFEQSLQMEKQQIIDAYYEIGRSHPDNVFAITKSAEEYYTSTYGSKGSDTTPSKTEISDEEIEKAVMDSMDYVYLNPNDSLIFHQGWMRAIKWYREQLKQRQ